MNIFDSIDTHVFIGSDDEEMPYESEVAKVALKKMAHTLQGRYCIPYDEAMSTLAAAMVKSYEVTGSTVMILGWMMRCAVNLIRQRMSYNCKRDATEDRDMYDNIAHIPQSRQWLEQLTDTIPDVAAKDLIIWMASDERKHHGTVTYKSAATYLRQRGYAASNETGRHILGTITNTLEKMDI